MVFAGSLSCAVCGGDCAPYRPVRVLDKYDVEYVRCDRCRLITLPSPTWLNEAYENPIFDGDVGLLRRCHRSSQLTSALLRAQGLREGQFLDWAGGYGTFSRMMRDRGYEFFHTDPYTQNIFARGIEADLDRRFDLITAFEVIEHLTDPIEQLRAVADATDFVFTSTQLQPSPNPDPESWWYFAPEGGQHVAIHTQESLEALASRLGMGVVSDGIAFHLFYRGSITRATRTLFSMIGARRLRSAGRSARLGQALPNRSVGFCG